MVERAELPVQRNSTFRGFTGVLGFMKFPPFVACFLDLPTLSEQHSVIINRKSDRSPRQPNRLVGRDCGKFADFCAWQPDAPGLKRGPGEANATRSLAVRKRGSVGKPKMRIFS
jgi:hypothetical protein